MSGRRGLGAAARCLRVVSYNVRRFLHPVHGQSTVSDVAESIAALGADIVCLNEVDVSREPAALQEIATQSFSLPAECGLDEHVMFFGHVAARYGNAILSRFPIVHRDTTHLEGGSWIEFPAGTKRLDGTTAKAGEAHRIARGLVFIDVELNTTSHQKCTPLRVACTHLDHISIDERKVQLRHIRKIFDGADHVILAGDFNALCAADYSSGEWERLLQRAQDNGWREPEVGDLDILFDAGFVDAAAAAASGDGRPGLTAPVSGGMPLYRIDYCFLRSEELQVSNSFVASDADFSDHYPLVCDFSSFDSGIDHSRRANL